MNPNTRGPLSTPLIKPLEYLLRMRTAIDDAIEATKMFGYEDFNEKLKHIRIEAREAFQKFDEYTSD